MKKDTTLFETSYIKVKKRDGWYDLTSSQGTNEIVAVLLRTIDGRFMVRMENCPPYYQDGQDKMSVVALTGMREKRENHFKGARREILEESGLKEKDYVLHYCGFVFTNKQSDTKIHLFIGTIVNQDVSKKGKLVGKGDGTKGEEGAYCFFTEKESILRYSKCGILYQLLSLF